MKQLILKTSIYFILFIIISCNKSTNYLINGRVINIATGVGLQNVGIKLFNEEDSKQIFKRKSIELYTQTDKNGCFQFQFTNRSKNNYLNELYYFIEFEQPFGLKAINLYKAENKNFYLPDYYNKDLSTLKLIDIENKDSVLFNYVNTVSVVIKGTNLKPFLTDGYINIQLVNEFDTIYSKTTNITFSNNGNINVSKEVIPGKQVISYQVLNNGIHTSKDTIIQVDSDTTFEFSF
mgnify:CR=1 FL=1|jgi:competence transcription factor ComK